MASIKGRLVRLVSGALLTRGTVADVQEIGAFVRVLIRCDVKTVPAGTKVQVLLPSDDMRTYTPIAAPEGILLLGWKHADGGPGARWLASTRVGDVVPFVGPQRSLALDPGPLVLVGDETSVAVAAAFAAQRPGNVRAVIQADATADVQAAAASVGLAALEVVAAGDIVATAAAVQRQMAAFGDASVAVTGGSELVVAVRSTLRAAGARTVKTKTHWIPGRAGLD